MNLRLWRHYQKNQAILKTQVTKIKTQVKNSGNKNKNSGNKNKISDCDYD